MTVIDGGEPRNAPAAHMHGFLTQDGLPPGELVEAGRAEVTRYGGELVDERVEAVRPGFRVRLADGSELIAGRGWSDDVVLFEHKFVPGTGMIDALGCDTDERGFVTVDANGATSTPGVWAAGNVVNSRAQVIVAAGAGAAAAMAIHADITRERTRFAVEADRG